MTATEFLTQSSMQDCAEDFTCMSSFPATATTGTFADNFGANAAACLADYADPTELAQVETQITAGKIMFDGVAAAACVAGTTYPACATYWTAGGNYPAACDSAINGTVADGAACVTDYDCSGAMSICDTTTLKCGPAPATARQSPADGIPMHRKLLSRM
jgi:hypothetical protein